MSKEKISFTMKRFDFQEMQRFKFTFGGRFSTEYSQTIDLPNQFDTSPMIWMSKWKFRSFYFTLVLGFATIAVGYFQITFWSIAAERQTRRLRETLFRSILNKEISYFDLKKSGEMNTRLSDDVTQVHDGIGDKIGSALQFVATFIAGIILG